jgi:hypothetical protein
MERVAKTTFGQKPSQLKTIKRRLAAEVLAKLPPPPPLAIPSGRGRPTASRKDIAPGGLWGALAGLFR